MSSLKGILAVCVVLALVVGVAVAESRAQPLTGATSPGFNNCQPSGPKISDRSLCRPIGRIALAVGEREFVAEGDEGGDLGYLDGANDVGGTDDPETLLAAATYLGRVVVAAAVGWAVKELLDYAKEQLGSGTSSAVAAANADTTIFDPQL